MAAQPATILCKHHNVPKVPMRNSKGAPMLGCPECHAKAPEPTPAPEPAPQPEPAPAPEPKPVPAKRRVGTFFHRLLED